MAKDQAGSRNKLMEKLKVVHSLIDLKYIYLEELCTESLHRSILPQVAPCYNWKQLSMNPGKDRLFT